MTNNWLPGVLVVVAMLLTSAGLIVGHLRRRAMRRRIWRWANGDAPRPRRSR